MKKKKLLLIVFAIVAIILTFSVSAFAGNAPPGFERFTSDSTYRPVDYSSHKSVSTVNLYGNADYICMKAYSETNKKEDFIIEIYSDSARTKKLMSHEWNFAKGTHYENFLIDLTGFKSGTYYATCYVEKKLNMPSFYDKYEKDPDTVVNFKISVNRAGTTLSKMHSVIVGYENSMAGPAIAWYSVPGAKGYYVYRYEDGKYKKVDTVKATQEDFVVYVDTAKANKNGTAYYKVKAYNGSKTTAYSDTVKVYLLKTPTVKATLENSGRVKISWNNCGSSCSYAVYRRTEKSEWVKLTSSTKNRYYYDYNVKNNTVYYYTVIAQNSDTVSGYNTSGAKVLCISAPKLNSVKSDVDSLTVSWNSVSGADAYIVYRKEAGTGWKIIATVEENSYTDTTVKKNKAYTFTVCAVNEGKNGPYSTTGVSGAAFDEIVLNDVEKIDNKSVRISWNDIGDVSYRVYRKNDVDTSWKHIATIEENEYTDTISRFVSGRTYTYTVKAYKDGVSGNYDKVGKSYFHLGAIKEASLFNTMEGVGFKWSKIECAEGYNIYRKSDGEYEFLATVDENKYEDLTAEAGIEYTYKIAYIFDGTEMTEYAKKIKCKLVTGKNPLSDKAPVFSGHSWTVYLDNTDKDAIYTVYKKENGVWNIKKNPTMAPDGFLILNSEIEEGSEYAVTAIYSDGSLINIPESGFILTYFDPVTPTVTVDQNNYSVNLSWDAVVGVEKYIIYSGDTELAVIDSFATEYKIENLKPDRMYSYRMGVVKNGVEIRGDNVRITVVKKENIESAKLNKDGITLTWNDTNKKYALYRKAEGETKWTRIYLGNKTSYTDTGAVDGTTYYYSLRAKYVDTYSAYSDVPVKITFVKTPKITNVKLSGSAITITWEKSDVVDYYIVYRKETVVENGTSKTGSWKKVYTTKNGSVDTYKDSDVEAGNKYTYGVKAISGSNKSLYNSKTVPFIAAPVVVSAKETTNGIKVTFKQTEGAAKYYIYRKVAGGEWVNIGTAGKTATSYTDKTAQKGIKYTYTVKGISGTTQSSNYSGKSCTRTK